MIPRASRRYASTIRPKQGTKAKTKPLVSAEEQVRIIKRRIDKAERDERMDITLAMTPSKTYMGGFTRPRDLRAMNWCKGGRYYTMGKAYESPSADAYQPHTVYLLEGRYLTKHGIGRADAHEHIVGICRESDFPMILRRYNSERGPQDCIQAMDNARWPWTPKKLIKRTKWWEKGEDPKAILAEIFGEDFKFDENPELFIEEESEDVPTNTITHLITPSSNSFSKPTQMRGFHSSARVLQPTSYNEDHVVPAFYVKHKQGRASKTSDSSPAPSPPANDSTPTDAELADDPKRQRRSVREHQLEEGALMQHLSDSILSDEIAASTRRLRSKVPVEHYDADGVLVHPSGYVVPSTDRVSAAAHSSSSDAPRRKEKKRNWEKDMAAQTAAVAERVLESDLDSFHTIGGVATKPRTHKVPFEIREPDGTVKHASGFVPPTPANEFKYSDSASLEGGMSSAVGRMKAREGKKGSGERGLHTTAPRCAKEVVAPVPVMGHVDAAVSAVRTQYLPTLAEQPFFRPLLTLTVSTRPLATTLARLSRALPKGLPFYASIPPEDRKHGPSFSTRMRCLRIGRMTGLAEDMSKLLGGARGGFVGIRFSPGQKGRAVMGEGLAEPLPDDKRVMGVGIGSWYDRAEELRHIFESVEDASYDVFAVDDLGKRTRYATGEELPYPARKSKIEDNLFDVGPEAREAILAEKAARKQDARELAEEMKGEVDPKEALERRRKRKERREMMALEFGPELAKALAGNVRGVLHH